MARPAKQEKRDRQLNVKLTLQELNWLLARAGSAGLKPVDFARAQLFAARRTRRKGAAAGQLAPLCLNHLSRIGNNLNQLARRFHQFQIPPPAALESALQAVRTIIRRASADGS